MEMEKKLAFETPAYVRGEVEIRDSYLKTHLKCLCFITPLVTPFSVCVCTYYFLNSAKISTLFIKEME